MTPFRIWLWLFIPYVSSWGIHTSMLKEARIRELLAQYPQGSLDWRRRCRQGWKEDMKPKLMFQRWNRQSSAIAHVKSLFTSQNEHISTAFGFLWRQKSEPNIFVNFVNHVLQMIGRRTPKFPEGCWSKRKNSRQFPETPSVVHLHLQMIVLAGSHPGIQAAGIGGTGPAGTRVGGFPSFCVSHSSQCCLHQASSSATSTILTGCFQVRGDLLYYLWLVR